MYVLRGSGWRQQKQQSVVKPQQTASCRFSAGCFCHSCCSTVVCVRSFVRTHSTTTSTFILSLSNLNPPLLKKTMPLWASQQTRVLLSDEAQLPEGLFVHAMYYYTVLFVYLGTACCTAVISVEKEALTRICFVQKIKQPSFLNTAVNFLMLTRSALTPLRGGARYTKDIISCTTLSRNNIISVCILLLSPKCQHRLRR